MIYDTLDHIAAYRGLGANMDRAIDYLSNTDLSRLAAGRYEVDGANVYLMIQEPEFRAPADAQFEAHRRYADIQLALSDVEEKGVALPLPAGTFMILLPQDAHMPNLKCGSAATGRKAVIKVRMER